MRFLLLLSACLISTFSNECKSQTAKEAYLLPDGYRGKIVVVYNRPFGDKAEMVNDTVFYKVPFDGVSVVTSQSVHKLEDCIFFIMDATGKKNKLDVLSYKIINSSPDSVRLKNKIGVFIFGTIGSCNPKEPESFCYSDFYVGSLNDMSEYYTPDKANEFMSRVEKKAKWRKH